MVRTKSGEQAKRLAAKLAAAADTPPPPKPAKPTPSGLRDVGDPQPAGDPHAVESAEDVARAEIIAQTRKGAVVAASLLARAAPEATDGVDRETFIDGAIRRCPLLFGVFFLSVSYKMERLFERDMSMCCTSWGIQQRARISWLRLCNQTPW